MRYTFCLLFVACASRPAPAPEPVVEPAPEPVTAEVAPTPAVEPEGEPAPEQSTITGYQDCGFFYVTGEPRPRGTPPKLTAWGVGTLDTYPDPSCAHIDGWAGVDHFTWGLAGGFAADSQSYLHCGMGEPMCALLDPATGAVTRKYTPKALYDDSPEGIFTDPVIKRAVSYYKIGVAAGQWTATEVYVAWSVSSSGDTLTYLLHERTTGAEVELATFDKPSDLAWIVLPEPAVLSPNGKTIALRATTQGNQTLNAYVKFVGVADALKRLYAATALKDPANADTWNSKLSK